MEKAQYRCHTRKEKGTSYQSYRLPIGQIKTKDIVYISI